MVKRFLSKTMIKLGAVFSKRANCLMVSDGLLITGQNPAFLRDYRQEAAGCVEVKGQVDFRRGLRRSKIYPNNCDLGGCGGVLRLERHPGRRLY